MDDSSGSTSVDPLTLPSSPLGRHQSPIKSNARALSSRSPNKQQFSSPSKSFIMDTGDGGNEQSPWRIKVTVQAEPRNGSSPSKKVLGKTTTVPLKGGSSSPAKRPARRTKLAEATESEMEIEVKRPQRKRKGTPIRRVAKRPSPAKEVPNQAAMTVGDASDAAVVPSPTKKPAKKSDRKSLGTMPTQRGQRLSQAREELDEALQDAVGEEDKYGDDPGDMPVSEAVQGDMTAMNEDFTMISVETLQSMKQNTSMLEDSQVGDRSAVNGSYWPSSPPQTQVSARGSAEEREIVRKVNYPNISTEAQYARDTPAKSFVQAFDAMSWKPTGRAAQEPTPADSSELQHSSGQKAAAISKEGRLHHERREDSLQAPQAEAHNVVVEEEAEAQLSAEQDELDGQQQQATAGDDDIWAEEASRSLEEDVEWSHLSHRSRQQSEPQQHQAPATAENLNDFFSGLSSKPARAKIPRTWRRSSGMDFTYSDSPAHSVAQEEKPQVKGDRGHAGSDDENEEAERGSGVLTPPSTDGDEDEADEELGDVEDDAEDMGASRSAFEPDAVATELQVRRGRQKEDQDSEDDESASDESALSPDGEDTGLFWQSNLPNVYQRPTRPSMAEQRKARNLSSLLDDTTSSNTEKQSAPGVNMPPPTQSTKRFPGSRLLAARREAASSSFTSTSSAEQTQHAKEKVVGSPLRKSLLKSSKIGGAVTAGRAAVAGGEEARSERYQSSAQSSQKLWRDPVEESVDKLSTSFASKASDQRQLLSEAALAPQMGSGRNNALDIQTASSSVNDESLWKAAAREEEVEEEASSPARSVDYSAASEVQYADYDESDIEGEDLHHSNEASQRMEDTTRSYEERLNLSSPQKIRVNFGDSSITTLNTAEDSSLLQAKRSYPPLFGSSQQHKRPASRGHQHQEHTLIPQPQSSEPGFLGRLTSTFWSAVVRPSGPTTFTEPVFPPSLRTRLRSRYGVLSNQHPWTYAHMRTLHRMMNSCTTGKGDSLVPCPGKLDLPSSLVPYVDKKGLKDTCGRPFHLTEQLAHCVWALMQTLVEPELISQMEKGEIDFIGDSMARACRGFFDEYRSRPRHGGDVVFEETEVKGTKPRPGREIGVEWVVRCVGACVFAQGMFERRNEDEEAEMLQKISRG